MDNQKVDFFLMANSKYFEPYHIAHIRETLLHMDESKWGLVQSVPFKDPTTILIVSIFLGHLGVDRFMIGDTGLGVGKLVTCGGLFIWYFIDLFLIMGDTRKKNFEAFNRMLHY